MGALQPRPLTSSRRAALPLCGAEHAGAGTLRYMAPELLSGSTKSLTPKVDIFALGMLMWEMVAGEVPWRHCSDMQVPLLVSALGSGRHARLG